MIKNIYKKACFLFYLLVCLSKLAASSEDINFLSIYLTWENDPTTTMTVRWITKKSDSDDSILFQKIDDKEWDQEKGTHINMPDDHPYYIHRVEIKNLSPDTCYQFCLNNDHKKTIYKFRTMPNQLTRPVRFVVGGDMLHDNKKYLAETNTRAASQDPDFAYIGGDIAYSVPRLKFFSESFDNWTTWLRTWTETMVSPDGRLIPLIIAIGNHEVFGRSDQTPEQAKFFYALFRAPSILAYQVLDFSNYLSLFVLDSGHTYSIDGKQKEWLKNNLMSRSEIENKFVIYHVPAYPSVRSYKQKASQKIRKHWVPLFEDYGIKAAFEHHDHAYKRTYPIFQDKVDPDKGILYLGDGAWGIKKPRIPNSPNKLWYLEKTESIRHFILVTLTKTKRQYDAIDSEGEIFDSASN